MSGKLLPSSLLMLTCTGVFVLTGLNTSCRSDNRPAHQDLAAPNIVELYTTGSLDMSVSLSTGEGDAILELLEDLRGSGRWRRSLATYVPDVAIRGDAYSFHLSGTLAIWIAPGQPQRTRRLSEDEMVEIGRVIRQALPRTTTRRSATAWEP